MPLLLAPELRSDCTEARRRRVRVWRFLLCGAALRRHIAPALSGRPRCGSVCPLGCSQIDRTPAPASLQSLVEQNGSERCLPDWDRTSTSGTLVSNIRNDPECGLKMSERCYLRFVPTGLMQRSKEHPIRSALTIVMASRMRGQRR
jgi:hypothetical protein